MALAGNKSRALPWALVTPALAWTCAFFVLPFIAMVVFSVGERGPAGGYQAAFTFAQYANLPARSAAYWNTLMLALLTGAGTTALGTLLALIEDRSDSRVRKVLRAFR